MATTIANNDYVIIDKNNIVISLFHGYDLPEYNEEMTNVMDVTDITPKPQITWSYDPSNDNFTAPPDPDPIEIKSELDLLKEELKETVLGDIEYMGNVFQAGPTAPLIINSYLSIIALDGSLPDGFFWLDKSNNKVFMTEEEFKGFASAVLNNYFLSFSDYVEKRQML